MKTITLTERQRWFIKCAIELKDAVLPLNPLSLDAKIFRKDYGVSKRVMEKEIKDLLEKIK